MSRGRLALREQGPWWVAYYMPDDTPEGAIELGRIFMGAVRISDKKISDSFKETMKLTLGIYFEKHLGADVDHWIEGTARDSDPPGYVARHRIGQGKTEEEAIADLMEQEKNQ